MFFRVKKETWVSFCQNSCAADQNYMQYIYLFLQIKMMLLMISAPHCSSFPFKAEEVRKLKERMDALQGLVQTSRAHTSRLTANDFPSSRSAAYMDNGVATSDNTLNLGASAFSDSEALQRTIRSFMQNEMHSETFQGTRTCARDASCLSCEAIV